MANYKMHLLCCGGTGCRASESAQIVANLKEEIKKVGMEDDVQVVVTGCFGFCEKGPIVKVMPDNTSLRRSQDPDSHQRFQTYGFLSETASYRSEKLRFYQS